MDRLPRPRRPLPPGALRRRPRPLLRAVVYTTAEQPPRLSVNRYPRHDRPGRVVIGIALRVGHCRLLSLVWRRP